MAGIGHNSKISLQQAADANVQTGVILLCKEALVTAIQDRRLQRGHLRVLAAIVSFMNARARAWPGRLQLALMTGLRAKTISNILLELRSLGYLVAEKETVPEAGDRRLTVYTLGNVDHETIRRLVNEWLETLRETGEKSLPGGNFNTRKVPAGGELPCPAGTSSSPPGGNNQQKVPAGGEPKSRPAGDSISHCRNRKSVCEKKQDGASATKDGSTTLVADGDFIISEMHDLRIAAETVAKWRVRFPHIDLDAQMERLSSYIKRGGIMHPGWSSPDGWMVGLLAKDNQRAIDEAKVTEARVVAAQGKSASRKTFAR